MACSAAMSLVGALGLGTAWTASADPGPVYPSKSQVDKAKAKVSSTAGEVSALDARYAAASARLSQVQDDASAAAEAYNGARLALDQATAEASAAAKRAADAQSQADAASLEVRRYASSVYQSGGSLGELDAYLSSTGPQKNSHPRPVHFSSGRCGTPLQWAPYTVSGSGLR